MFNASNRFLDWLKEETLAVGVSGAFVAEALSLVGLDETFGLVNLKSSYFELVEAKAYVNVGKFMVGLRASNKKF